MSLSFDLDTEVVRLIRMKLIELPTYPGVALRLQRLINGNDFGLEELVKLVEADAALASHVLRAANSAFFRASTPVTTLQQAITRVGASELSNIAIAGTLGVQASLEGPLAAMRRESWRRSLVGGLLSQELARSRRLDPGEAFLAGLLHDFGETIAYRTFEVILELHPHTAPLNAAQWQWHAQKYHVELGMALAAEWKLPAYLEETVRRHHDDDTSFCDFPKMVELIALTDAISTHLFDAPALEAATLPNLVGLSTPERDALGRLIPRLPSLLHSLDVPGIGKPVPSLVAPTPTVVPATAPELELSVKIMKRDHADEYRSAQLSEHALKVKGPHPQTERHLVSVELEDVKFSATVMSCSVADDGCVIELKPFAMAGEALTRWKALVHKAAPVKAA